VTPTSGTLHVDGQEVSGMSAAQLRELRNRKMSMVFQHFALFPHRTNRDNAAYGLRVRGVSEKERLAKADKALKTVGLADWGDAYPDELSGGMRQRVGLARALATEADVLLMDEPFSALDPLIRREMQDLLVKLQQELHRTIIFVTHDLNEAMRLGDRIMVMRNGRVIQLATGAEILSSPADEYISEFVSDVDRSRVLTASSIMQEPLVTASLDHTPQEVLSRLSNFEANGVYVLDGDGRIRGITTDQLLRTAIDRRETSVSGCLTDEFDTARPDDHLVNLCSIVGRRSVPLAVTDSAGVLLGVVPRATLLHSFSVSPRRMANA
jgi:glycine betaine/proline transport system ATP-binding protein